MDKRVCPVVELRAQDRAGIPFSVIAIPATTLGRIIHCSPPSQVECPRCDNQGDDQSNTRNSPASVQNHSFTAGSSAALVACAIRS